MALRHWFRSRSMSASRRPRLGFLQLEDRTVPSVGFDSAFGVGNATGPSSVSAVAADAAGNSYVAGTFSGTTDFDPDHVHAGDTDILTCLGDNDSFVAKYAPDNTLIWARRMGNDSPAVSQIAKDAARDLAVDAAGNVYVTGQYSGTADFGPINLTSVGGADGFVAKLDASGTFQWARSWGTAADEIGSSVGVDSGGNVYVAGLRLAATQAQSGVDVLKFSATGSAAWAEWINTQWSLPPALAVNGAGNVFIASSFTGIVDFDPSPKTTAVSAGPSASAYVLELTNAGKLGWVSTFVGQTVSSTTGFAFGQSIALDGSGNVVVEGHYSGTVDFDPGRGVTTLTATSSNCAFITKLNAQGGLVWARSLDGATGAYANGLAVDAAGSIYATGSFQGTVDFDPGAGVASRTSAGGSDAFVLKLTSAGTFAWVDTFGGTGNDSGSGIAVDSAGTVYLVGSYQGTVAFDLDPTGLNDLTDPGPYVNGYLVKLTQS
jgi:hypothetical protein